MSVRAGITAVAGLTVLAGFVVLGWWAARGELARAEAALARDEGLVRRAVDGALRAALRDLAEGAIDPPPEVLRDPPPPSPPPGVDALARFAARLAEIERLLDRGEAAGAAEAYGRLAEEEANGRLVAVARLGQGAALRLAGRGEEALEVYGRLLDRSPAEPDLSGVPVGLYAGVLAAELHEGRAEVAAAADRWAEVLHRLVRGGWRLDAGAAAFYRRRVAEGLDRLGRGAREAEVEAVETALAAARAGDGWGLAPFEGEVLLFRAGAGGGLQVRRIAVEAVEEVLVTVAREVAGPAGFRAEVRADGAGGRLPAPIGDGALVLSPDGETRLSLRGAYRRAHLVTGLLIVVTAIAGAALVLTHRALRRENLAMRARTDLLDAVAHELKSPVAGIRALSESLAEGSGLPEAGRAQARLVLREAVRLTAVVDNALEVARADAEAPARRHERVDLAGLVHEVAEVYRPHAARVGLAVRVEVGEGEMAVEGDAGALARLVSNLVDNAVKYADPRLTGDDRSDRRWIRIGLDREAGARVRLDVEDRGVGIPEAERGRLFERFRRAPPPGAPVCGVGLGLWVARRIAREHGGDIEVAGDPGEGTVFRVDLPSAPVSCAEARP